MTDEAAFEAQIEAMARAIHNSERTRVAGRTKWEDVDNAWRLIFLATARAAAEAIGLKPGCVNAGRIEALIEAAELCERHEQYYTARDKTTHANVAGDLGQSLRAMIAASLPRQPEKE